MLVQGCCEAGTEAHVGVGCVSFLFFFFQAEDGIRDLTVTGVQTCALPISAAVAVLLGLLSVTLGRARAWARGPSIALELLLVPIGYYMTVGGTPWLGVPTRSEERRVGKECRSRWSPYH